MWTALINADKQRFEIEDREGNRIVVREMPSQKFPNPGKAVLMDIPENRQAWEAIWDLVQAANRGQK